MVVDEDNDCNKSRGSFIYFVNEKVNGSLQE